MPAEITPVTHGVTHRATEVGPFRLTETSHGPHTRLERHRHAHPAATFVLRGRFLEDFGSGRHHDCEAMSVLVKPADAAHTNRYSSDGARSFILECDSSSPYASTLDACAPQFGLARLGMRMLELHAAFRSGAPEQLVLAEEIALEISREQRGRADWRTSRRPPWLDDLADTVATNCTRPIGLTTLASGVAVHPVYLARVFRRHYGQSIGGFMLQCRVRLAMHRLAMTREPIARIAMECGFADQAHLTRVFRRETGMSPGRFRDGCGKVLGPQGQGH